MNNWLKFNQKLNPSTILHTLFPQKCILCAVATNSMKSLCQDCISNLPLAPSVSCPQCGITTTGEVCGRCLKNPPHFDSTLALFTYAFPVDAILQHYKYNNALYLGELFGTLLSESIFNTACDVIMPMPLHSKRLQDRGFNQSLEVAKILAKQLDIPLDQTSCTRIKDTAPQASLPLGDRLKNMRNAFDIKPNQLPHQIKGKHIVIIDDVMTTGSSLNELAKTLKAAGAKRVDCWVIARASIQ